MYPLRALACRHTNDVLGYKSVDCELYAERNALRFTKYYRIKLGFSVDGKLFDLAIFMPVEIRYVYILINTFTQNLDTLKTGHTSCKC